MHWLNQLLQMYSDLTRANPLVATLALPIIGGIMFYLKDVPKKLWDLLVAYTTVTMSLNNAGYDGNLDAYNAFDKWFMQSGYKKWSKTFFMFRQYSDDLFQGEEYKPYRMGVGNGKHFFFYKGKFFWFVKGKLESGGSEKLKEEISIHTFGWSHQVFEDLVNLFNEKKHAANVVMIHKFDASTRSWEEVGKIGDRGIETFCMNSEQKAEILKKIGDFQNRRAWYKKKGLTYKTSFLFFGPPGTGKTTLSKLLAAHFKKDIYLLDLNGHTNNSLVDALSKIKPGSFLLIEDVDQSGSAVKDRTKKKELTDVLALDLMGNGLTMSGMLNAFDGVISLDNLIIIMTTNHPEDIDAAIRRKSRIDNEYLIDELGPKEIWDYAVIMYDLEDKHLPADPNMLTFLNSSLRLPGCEVENTFKEYPESVGDFLNEICHRADLRLKKAA